MNKRDDFSQKTIDRLCEVSTSQSISARMLTSMQSSATSTISDLP